jgi:hypothetical protein
MDLYGPLVFVGLMTLCILGFHGGILFGVRFLRERNLIDIRVLPFIVDTLFGNLGTNYKLFYREYARVHGRQRALLALGVHFGCLLGFILFPFLAAMLSW